MYCMYMCGLSGIRPGGPFFPFTLVARTLATYEDNDLQKMAVCKLSDLYIYSEKITYLKGTLPAFCFSH